MSSRRSAKRRSLPGGGDRQAPAMSPTQFRIKDTSKHVTQNNR